jgi:hypothetical protein
MTWPVLRPQFRTIDRRTYRPLAWVRHNFTNTPEKVNDRRTSVYTEASSEAGPASPRR